MLSQSEIKLIKSLTKKKYRKLNQLFVVEGERLVSEVIQSKIIVKQLYLTEGFASKSHHNYLMDSIAENAIITRSISDREMNSISETVSSSGILALCQLPELSEMNISNSDNWLYLDEIQDPGNLGTLLRSADWFGVENVALSENCVDAFNTKVLRSGMGSQFRLNLFKDVKLTDFYESTHTVLGAYQDGDSIQDIDIKPLAPWVLVIGNEARGISGNCAKYIDLKITIPKIGSGESLNAAIAGSIILTYLTKPL